MRYIFCVLCGHKTTPQIMLKAMSSRRIWKARHRHLMERRQRKTWGDKEKQKKQGKHRKRIDREKRRHKQNLVPPPRGCGRHLIDKNGLQLVTTVEKGPTTSKQSKDKEPKRGEWQSDRSTTHPRGTRSSLWYDCYRGPYWIGPTVHTKTFI